MERPWKTNVGWLLAIVVLFLALLEGAGVALSVPLWIMFALLAAAILL